MNLAELRRQDALPLGRLAFGGHPLDGRRNQGIAALFNTSLLNTRIKERP
jgi:hypothetical protein